jgi:hypothetical protein
MKATVWAVILGISLAVAEPIVIEYQKVIETHIQQDLYSALQRKITTFNTAYSLTSFRKRLSYIHFNMFSWQRTLFCLRISSDKQLYPNEFPLLRLHP